MAASEHLSPLTDEQVRDTVGRLKRIEEKAAAVLETVSKERATFNRRVYAEIERRKSQINEEMKRDIDNINEQSAKTQEQEAVKIERECEEKKTAAAEIFAANSGAWRKIVFDNILAGI